MNRGWLYSLLAVVVLSSCSYETLDYSEVLNKELELRLESIAGSKDSFLLPDHTDYAAIPQDPKNPLTKAKVTLGRFLFFETGLGIDASQNAGMETYSCATCHDPQTAFKPAAQQGVADGGFGYGTAGEMRVKNPAYGDFEVDAQAIRPLTVLNVAFVSNTFWDGRFGGNNVNIGTEHLWNDVDGTTFNELGMLGPESQNIEGVHVHRMRMGKERAEEFGYKDLYDEAFPEFDESERYGQVTTAFALTAYIRALITDQTPWQRWLRGDKLAMSDEEIKGALVFFGKARCFNCHTGPALSAVEFHALGVKNLHQAHPNPLATTVDDARNFGRGGFTGKDEDMFAYKIPQLYNMKDNPFFFHGGSKTSLEEVVEYKSKAQTENPDVPQERLSSKFQPFELTHDETKSLLEFLKHSLYDPNLDRYVPDFVMSGNCFPNNDARSKNEIGCD